MGKFICNMAHVCDQADTCRHAVLHDAGAGTMGCGPSMPCADDPSGAISVCVPVSVDGEYLTYHRDWCPHCGGRGYHDRTETHKAQTGVAT